MEALVGFGVNPVAIGTGLLPGAGSGVSPTGKHGGEGPTCPVPAADASGGAGSPRGHPGADPLWRGA